MAEPAGSLLEEAAKRVAGPVAGSQPAPAAGIQEAARRVASGETRISRSEEELAAIVGQAEIPKGGMRDLGARFLIQQAETRAEKAAEFRRRYPEGDLFFVPRSLVEQQIASSTDARLSKTTRREDAESFLESAPFFKDMGVTPEQVMEQRTQYKRDLSAVNRGDDIILFRPDKASLYRRLDAKDIGEGGAMEVLGDLVDIVAPDIGAIVGEGLSISRLPEAMMRRGTPAGRALSIFELLLRGGAGAAGGQMLQEGIQQARGINVEPVSATAERATGQAITSVIGGGLINSLGRPLVNMVRGAGLLHTRTGGPEAIRAARRLGLDGLPADVVSANPIVRRLGAQARAGSPISTLADRMEADQTALEVAVEKLAGRVRGGPRPQPVPGTDEQAIQLVQDVLAEENRRILVAARNSGGLQAMRSADGGLNRSGRALMHGVAEWDLTQRGLIDTLYAHARGIEEPVFDFAGPKDAARQLLQAVPVPVRGAPREAGPRVLGPDGEPMEAAAEQIGIEYINNLRGEVRKAAQLIERINEDVIVVNGRLVDRTAGEAVTLPEGIDLPEGEFSMMDVMRALREQLFDLSQPDPLYGMRSENRQARQLYSSLTDSMRNPVNGNEAFVAAWRQADQAARSRFDTLEMASVGLVRRSTPDQTRALATQFSNLSDPAAADRIAYVRSILPADAYRDFQTGIADELLSDLPKLKGRLDAARPENLELILNQADRQQLHAAAEAYTRMQELGIEKIALAHDRLGNFAMDLVERGGTRQASVLGEIVQRHGGRESPFGRTLRAGILQGFLDRTRSLKPAMRDLDTNTLNREISKLQEHGIWRLLTTEDRQVISDVQQVRNMLRMTQDVGAGIAAAGQVRGLLGGATRSLIENVGIGRALIQEPWRSILIGRGTRRQLNPSRAAHGMATTLLRTASDAEAVFGGAVDLVDSTIRAVGGGGEKAQ